jgi:hypothetical protein
MSGYLDGPYNNGPYTEENQSMTIHSKFLFQNADNQNEQATLADSIKFASFLTANYELTDELLGKLVNAITERTGVADAAKFVKTNAQGYLDISFLLQSGIDHGSISGLLDDDHTQYLRTDGTRALTGNQSAGNNKITNLANGSANGDAVNFGQLQQYTAGLQDFRESVKDKDLLTPPASPATGDRYVIGQPSDTATGAWAGHAGEIAEWSGSAWVFEAQPDKGTYTYVEDESSAYVFNNNTFASGSWVVFSSGTYTASNGVKLVGADFQADLKTSGGLKISSGQIAVEPSDLVDLGLIDSADKFKVDLKTAGGLKFSGNQIMVEPADFAGDGLKDDGTDQMALDLVTGGGLKIVSGQAAVEPSDFAGEGLVDDGSDNLKLDWSTLFNDAKPVKASDLSSTATGKGASIIGIEDSAGNFTATNVEGALAEAYDKAVQATETRYTAAVGGVASGDLVFISANDTVKRLPVSGTDSQKFGIGIAKATTAGGSQVAVASDDIIVPGILSGATAGERYFWSGTAIVNAAGMPNTPGHRVWQVGVAKNATDLHVQVEFLRVNG